MCSPITLFQPMDYTLVGRFEFPFAACLIDMQTLVHRLFRKAESSDALRLIAKVHPEESRIYAYTIKVAAPQRLLLFRHGINALPQGQLRINH